METPPDIYGGKAPRELAFYSGAEAARIVRVHPDTLRAWAFGRSYATADGSKRWPPLIRAASPKKRRLSFANLVELHVLSVLRGRRVRVDRIRAATRFVRDAMHTNHPLADVDTHTDCVHIYVEYLGKLISASSSEVVLRPMVERHLERIERDERGLAARLYPIVREDGSQERSILIDPSRHFGRPVLASANIETAAIADRFLAGDSTDELATDFAVEASEIEDAVRFEALRRAA